MNKITVLKTFKTNLEIKYLRAQNCHNIGRLYGLLCANATIPFVALSSSMLPLNSKHTLAKALYISLCLVGVTLRSSASVSVAAIFSDNMVLQRNAKLEIWGTGSPDETIKVIGSWNDRHELTTKTGEDGRWHVNIKTSGAGGPYTLKVEGSNSVEYTNVMLGEVWLCGGQSNMEFPLENAANGHDELLSATNFAVRLFNQKHISGQNASESIGSWQTCSPASAAHFSAVAYFYGLELNKKLGVPIGLINCSWGCTHIEEWIDKRLIGNDPEAVQSAIANTDCHHGGLGNLYDGMIAPLVPYQMAGFIWYQGESNRFMPDNYQMLLEFHSARRRRCCFWLATLSPCFMEVSGKAVRIRVCLICCWRLLGHCLGCWQALPLRQVSSTWFAERCVRIEMTTMLPNKPSESTAVGAAVPLSRFTSQADGGPAFLSDAVISIKRI